MSRVALLEQINILRHQVFVVLKVSGQLVACVAGGSGCARETFCGEAASKIPACLISYPF